MKKVFSLFVIMVFAAGLMSSCDAAEKLCGPCGEVANGDSTITGITQLDGVLKAVGTLKMSSGAVKANFDGRLAELAGVFGINAEGMATADIIAEIQTQFDAQISANLQGGISVKYEEPSCSANLSVSASASAQCEAKAGCDVDVNVQCDPGELSVACEGKCTGGCSGGCTGSCTLSAEAAAECSGTCKGSCDLTVSGGECEGTCKGECEGTCEVQNTDGSCAGSCEGTCTGNCELPEVGGSCSGECKGECKVELAAEAECSGKCEGSCSAECTGGCEGTFDPPSCGGNADVECEAEADCSAQAEAQASASLECTPPSIQIDYQFSASADASAQAEVEGKLKAVKVKLVEIFKGFAEMRGLIEGNADLGIDPPVVTIGDSITALGDAVAAGEIKIEYAGLAACAIPALEEAGQILVDVPTEMGATLQAQIDLLAVFDIAG
jgi:hypothetical protein